MSGDKCRYTRQTRCGECPTPQCIYKLFIFWILISCLLASTATYLAFQGQLDPWIQELTGGYLSWLNDMLSLGAWLCLVAGTIGPLVMTLFCIMLKPVWSVPLVTLTIALLSSPSALIFTSLYSRVRVLLNTTSTPWGGMMSQANMSAQVSQILETKMWSSLHKYSWNGDDSLTKAWNSTQINGCFPIIEKTTEDTLREVTYRVFIAVIVMGVWVIFAITCPWMWIFLEISPTYCTVAMDEKMTEQIRRKSLSKIVLPSRRATNLRNIETKQTSGVRYLDPKNIHIKRLPR